MNRKRLSLLTAAATAIPAAGLMLASAAGPNLLQNGDFSNGVAGWSDFYGNPQAVNGAMQLTNGYQGTGNSYYSALQCVTNIQEGANYTAKGDAYVELGQTPYGAAGIYVNFNTGPNCDGSNLGGGHAAGGFIDAQRGIWIPLTHSVTAPAGAKSVYIRPTALKEPKPYGSSAPETFVVLFDNLEFFETNGSSPVPDEPAEDQPPVEEPSPDPVEEPSPDPADDPQPQDDPQPEDDPQSGDDPQPEDDPVPGGGEEPGDVPEVPEIPEIPQIPEFPPIPEFPQVPDQPQAPEVPAGDGPAVPEQPQPQQPAPEGPAPQPGTPEPATPPAPEVTVPLPPATGNGLAASRGGALPGFLLALGVTLAGIGSVATAAVFRNRR